MTDYAIEEPLKDSTPKPQPNTSYQGMIWRRFFKHRGAVVGAIVLAMVFLSVILAGLSPYDPNEPNMKETLQPPSLSHPMGTDALGRDYLTACPVWRADIPGGGRDGGDDHLDARGDYRCG